MNPRTRSVVFGCVVLALAALAWMGFKVAQNARAATADRVTAFVKASALKGESGTRRAQLLRELQDMVNSLSIDERRKWWESGVWKGWFGEMTEIEKAQYIDATMPTSFGQVLNEFEKLPDDRRKKFIDATMKELNDNRRVITDHEPGRETPMYGTNAAPILSADLEKRARTIGLKTLYTQSSAETKAELAPFLEELQHQMQLGKVSFQQ